MNISRAPVRPHPSHVLDSFAEDVLIGLSKPQKAIPSRWLYDERGSELFEEITHLPEYYLTRSEIEILERRAGEMAGFVRPNATVVEFGSGSSRKTPLLLEALDRPEAYVPIDVSREYLADAAITIGSYFPDLEVLPQLIDFTGDFSENLKLPPSGQKVGFFPGSTIGNLSPPAAISFFQRARSALGPDAILIVGVDMQKPRQKLIDAYNDSKGVTAAFNKNLLARINRELKGNFEFDGFRHEARYDDTVNRMEMHLVSTQPQLVSVCGASYAIPEGDSIHTENSYKYTLDGFRTVARSGGWDTLQAWQDAHLLYSVLLLAPCEG